MKYVNMALEIVGDVCSSKTRKEAVQLCCSIMDLWDTEFVELVSQREKCYGGRCHAVSHIHCVVQRTEEWRYLRHNMRCLMQPKLLLFLSMCISITIPIQPFKAFNMNHLMNHNKWGHFTAALLI